LTVRAPLTLQNVLVPDTYLGQEHIFFYDLCEKLLYQYIPNIDGVMVFRPATHSPCLTATIYDTKRFHYVVNGVIKADSQPMQTGSIDQLYRYNPNNTIFQLPLLTNFGNIAIQFSVTDINVTNIDPAATILPIPLNQRVFELVYTYVNVDTRITVKTIFVPIFNTAIQDAPYLEVGESLTFSFFRPARVAAVTGTNIWTYLDSTNGVGDINRGVGFNPPRWTSNIGAAQVRVTFTFDFTLTQAIRAHAEPWSYRIGTKVNSQANYTSTAGLDNVPVTTYPYNGTVTLVATPVIGAGQYLEFGDFFRVGRANALGRDYSGTATITIFRIA